MIRDTVSLLCRNTLSRDAEIRIQGLIGITVDDSQVFLVQFDELYGSDVSSNACGKQQNVDDVFSSNISVDEPPITNARKRPRLSESADPATACNISAQQSADAVSDCDVIFVADDVNDNNVKLEYDQLCSSFDDNRNLFLIGDSNQVFKTEEVSAATDLNVFANNGETRGNPVNHGSGRNTLLRSMLASQNSYTPDKATSWQSSVYSEMMMPTDSVRHEQATARPRIKQVVIWFIGRGVARSKHWVGP